MTRLLQLALASSLLAAGCSRGMKVDSDVGLMPIKDGKTELSPAATVVRPVSDAEVHFMTGMISHHAQAVIMAGWAPSHGASAALQRFCERVVNAQTDEIDIMRNWLREKGKPVPSATDTKMHMSMGGMTHSMMMPGMMSDEEMAALDKARGVEFDRLFLTGMIKHHQGAITMIDEVLAAPGSVNDEVVFKFTNDIFADQSTEIAVMEKMLATLPPR